MGTRIENAKRTKRIIDIGLSGAIASGAVSTEKIADIIKPLDKGKKYWPGESFSFNGKVYGVADEFISNKSYSPESKPEECTYLGLATKKVIEVKEEVKEPKGGKGL